MDNNDGATFNLCIVETTFGSLFCRRDTRTGAQVSQNVEVTTAATTMKKPPSIFRAVSLIGSWLFNVVVLSSESWQYDVLHKNLVGKPFNQEKALAIDHLTRSARPLGIVPLPRHHSQGYPLTEAYGQMVRIRGTLPTFDRPGNVAVKSCAEGKRQFIVWLPYPR
jgi:hypothetical protein